MDAKSRLLVVDDEKGKSESYCRYLKSRSFDVTVARSGLSALLLAQDILPNFVLAFEHLPDIDGASLCRFLKWGSKTAKIPVIMISGDKRGRCLPPADSRCGYRSCVIDPISPELLARRLERCPGRGGT